ncbi:hypothetical protein AYO45_06125 [Gammaproteobacteria bacterium SCGC AG-212-F23]|nr:hypothetical protein AYO45_06125 [Gammaproteobacteria bacterium SCGC AG-212-F23]
MAQSGKSFKVAAFVNIDPLTFPMQAGGALDAKMNFMEIATQLRNREVKDVYILDERYGSADDYKQVDQAKAAITAQGLECKGVITPRDLTAFVESSEFYNRVNPISLKAHYDKKNEKGAKMAVQTYLGKIREITKEYNQSYAAAADGVPIASFAKASAGQTHLWSIVGFCSVAD